MTLPGSARVVIVGGGIMGVSLLYHLALEGWTDVVLIEKGELTSGSTWHAAGHVPFFNGSYALTKINRYANELYPKLEAMTGVGVSWHGCGSLWLATQDHEVDRLKYIHGLSKLADYEGHLISGEEIKQYHPFLNTDDVKLAFRTVGDGHVAPADVTNAMASAASKLGSSIQRRCRVLDIKRLPTGEWKVSTERGEVVCEHVVNAAGSYAQVVGSWTGHRVPLVNMLHHYFVTEPLTELTELGWELPIVRDPFSSSYLRQEGKGLLIGPYEREGAVTCWNGGAPGWDFENELLPPELERLIPSLEKATERLPLFGKAGIRSIVPGAITHTPDGNFLLGPAAGPRGYWMATGASVGICMGPGAGKYLAQWMVHGAADISMREFDPRRFGDWASDQYVAEVSIEEYGDMFQTLCPHQQHVSGRPVRKSAIHDRLVAAGGQFQQAMGWERPRWFDATGEGEQYSFRRSNWWEPVKAECLAVRQEAGLIDMSSFSKFEIRGEDATTFLDRMSANRLPRKDGGVGLMYVLTDSGRILSELTVTRLAANCYFALSAASAQSHDMSVLTDGLLPGERVEIVDVTDDFGTLLLTGPKSREILQKCTSLKLDNESFPWLTAQVGTVCEVAGVRLLRVSYAGELGWEIHCPTSGMLQLFDRIVDAGTPLHLRLFGMYALNSLRMEKAYKGWGSELTNEINLVEASMERFVRFDKDFVGKQATLSAMEQEPSMKSVYIEVDATDADCRTAEPIFVGNRVVGLTTSGAYGFAVEKSLAFAVVEREFAEAGQELEVFLFGDLHRARILGEPAYDARNLRLRS